MNGILESAFSHSCLRTVELVDDFIGLDTTTWNTTVTDSGSVAEDADGVNGVVTLLPSDGTVADNDEAYLYTNEISKYLNGKPISILALIQFAEGNTDDVNILFGIGEGFGAANTLQDNGAGPPADYDGACFFKVDGATLWNFESSLGTTQTTNLLNYTAGGSEYQLLGIDLLPLNSTEMQAVPWISQSIATNGIAPVQAMPSPQTTRDVPVKHRFSYSSPGEMAVCFGIKNGAATTVEALNVDLFVLRQNR